MNILVFNPGSSSLKFQLLDTSPGKSPQMLIKGIIERLDQSDGLLRIFSGGPAHPHMSRISSMQDATDAVLAATWNFSIDAIGYRVVHGANLFDRAARITPSVLDQIKSLKEMAPLHNAAAVECMEAGLRRSPETPAYALFDTCFHRTIPDVARLYAIPRELARQHNLYRFGFHGISHAYVSGRLLHCMQRKTADGSRIITCHLGNGASLCAIRDGKSVDISMGLTPLEGLVMGTRSGDVDPGLVLHLIRVLKMSPPDVDDLLNHRSGLLGLSGRSSDLRDLEEAAAAGDDPADAAIEAFAYRCRKYLGAYAAVLGGIDGVAFAGGMGEHSAGLRARILRGMEFLGMKLDEVNNQNASGDREVSIAAGRVAIWVIPTDEERQIAEEIFSIYSPAAKSDRSKDGL